MSTSAYLVCAADGVKLGLGKPLRDRDGTIRSFGTDDEPEFVRALWKFLDGCAGRGLELRSSSDPEYDAVATGTRDVGGWVEDGDIPYDQYLAGEPVEPTTYYALVGVGYPREAPSGIVRRRLADGRQVDEAFTCNLRWEPTEYLRRYALGHDDVDHVEITEAEAVTFVLRTLVRLLQRS